MFNSPLELAVILFFLGACLGSFANVLILRMPAGQSVVAPRSRCNKCQKQINWYDNIPIFSWFILKGKCRNCSQPFSFRYPFVELLMAVLFAAVGYSVGFKWSLIEYLILVFGLVTITFIDIDHYIIPDKFTLPGMVLGVLGSVLNPEREWTHSILGILMGGGFLWAVAFVYQVVRKQEGMGGGDIKLLGWIGAVLGWTSVPFVILSSSVIGSIFGIFTLVRQRKNLQHVLPFGPFLAAGAIIFILGGHKLAYEYLILFFPWLDPFDI